MNLALFDFDGTLTTRETFPDFLAFATTPWRLAVGRIVLAPLAAGYKLGLVPGHLIRAVAVRFAFGGLPEDALAAAGRRFAREVLPSFDRGLLTPVIDRRYPLAEVADAHRHMEANANVGKIVLDVSA